MGDAIPTRSISAVAAKPLLRVRAQFTGRGIGFQSAPPVFPLDPFAFFIRHARLEHCRCAFPVKFDPAFDLGLRHFVVAADAFANFASYRFNIGRHGRRFIDWSRTP
jgi:hypothetical protein